MVPGFLRAATTPGGMVADPGFLDTLYTYAWFVTFALSAVIYLVLMRTARQRGVTEATDLKNEATELTKKTKKNRSVAGARMRAGGSDIPENASVSVTALAFSGISLPPGPGRWPGTLQPKSTPFSPLAPSLRF